MGAGLGSACGGGGLGDAREDVRPPPVPHRDLARRQGSRLPGQDQRPVERSEGRQVERQKRDTDPTGPLEHHLHIADARAQRQHFPRLAAIDARPQRESFRRSDAVDGPRRCGPGPDQQLRQRRLLRPLRGRQGQVQVGGVDATTADDRPRRLGVPSSNQPHQRLPLRSGPPFQEQREDLRSGRLRLPRRPRAAVPQRSPTPLQVFHVRVGTALEQKFHKLEVGVLRGDIERCDPAVVRGVDIDPRRQQGRDGRDVSLSRRGVHLAGQRRRLEARVRDEQRNQQRADQPAVARSASHTLVLSMQEKLWDKNRRAAGES